MNRVTQKHIAQSTGVNKSTVSRALSGDPCIPRETVARIQQVARQMGYQPDPLVNAIAASRWRGNGKNKRLTFAFISQFRKPHAGVDWINLAGAEARAAEYGCRIDKFTL